MQFKQTYETVLRDIFARETSFSNKISLMTDYYYRTQFGSIDLLSSESRGSCLSLYGMTFTFDERLERYKLNLRDYSSLELICVGYGILRNLNSINKRGYVTVSSLNSSFVNFIMNHLESLGYERIILGNSELPYTLWYNLIFISYYHLLNRKLLSKAANSFDESFNFNDFENTELQDELDSYLERILARLDQYLKSQVKKRGITVIQNQYIGFDTEYTLGDERKLLNRLVSAQTAVQTRTILKVPLYHPYDVSYVNPLSSEISDIFINKVDNGNSYAYEFTPTNSGSSSPTLSSAREEKKIKLNEIRIINESLKSSIESIRNLLFPDLHSVNKSLINKLKELNKLCPESFCFSDFKRDQFVFSFPLTPLKTCIKYPERVGDSVSLDEILELSLSEEKISCGDLISIFDSFSSELELKNFSPSPNNPIFDRFRGGGVVQKPAPENLDVSAHQGAREGDSNLINLGNSAHQGAREGAPILNHVEMVDKPSNVNLKNLYLPPFATSLHLDLIFILKLFSNLGFKFNTSTIISWFEKAGTKARSRTSFLCKEVKVSFSIVKNCYIMGHFNAADIPMLSDWESDLKPFLSVVNKSFVTLGKPLKYKNRFIYVRDTILLAPAGSNSLAALGKLYEAEGDFSKREISKKDILNMDKFLKRDKIAFEEYALQDAIITLKHALAMECFNMTLNQIGIPLTLSSMGRNYVSKEWSRLFKRHMPYQISGEYLMGNADELQTPKGLFASRDIGAHMSYFIANYKGGRNESFMYGCDEKTHWWDYDLTSAYTTGMADLALPDYFNGGLINPDVLKDWSPEQFLTGYLIVNGTFEFPKEVKYPSIPCYIDKNSTVYPRKGVCFLTGPEFWLAKRQGCDVRIKSAFYIHPKERPGRFNKGEDKKKVEFMKPFHAIITDIQTWRRVHPKGSILNLLYKEMGNSIYGNVVRGMSNKKSFDSITGKSFRVTATNLSNPILASWITAFIRSVIGECLHNIQKLGGKIVSVTTDGFITDLDDLENKLLSLPKEDTVLLTKYRALRGELTDGKSNEALEIKSHGCGIISWTTRGQLAVEGKMVATTGFQRAGYEKDELVGLFKDILSTKDKFVEYTRKSLRGAKDIFDKGGHVTAVLKDQVFRLFYDNRRNIIEPEEFKYSDSVDMSKMMLDSEPLENIDVCKALRFTSKFPITLPFNKNNANKSKSLYKTKMEIGVRNFIKGYYSNNFGLLGNEFKYAQDLINFIYGNKSAKKVKITTASISKLKNRKIIFKPVPATNENLEFVEYLKFHLPHFRADLFINEINS
jgi:hypothetical protein